MLIGREDHVIWYRLRIFFSVTWKVLCINCLDRIIIMNKYHSRYQWSCKRSTVWYCLSYINVTTKTSIFNKKVFYIETNCFIRFNKPRNLRDFIRERKNKGQLHPGCQTFLLLQFSCEMCCEHSLFQQILFVQINHVSWILFNVVFRSRCVSYLLTVQTP